jgi:outer membrane biosynthesis protein TonB
MCVGGGRRSAPKPPPPPPPPPPLPAPQPAPPPPPPPPIPAAPLQLREDTKGRQVAPNRTRERQLQQRGKRSLSIGLNAPSGGASSGGVSL